MLYQRWAPLTQQTIPQIVRVDQSHPLGRGLVVCVLLGTPGQVDLNLGSAGGFGNTLVRPVNLTPGDCGASHHYGLATDFDSGVSGSYLSFEGWRIASGADYSVAAWAYRRSAGEGNFGRICQKNSTGLLATAGNAITFEVGGVSVNSSTNVMPNNTWTHVCCTQRSGVEQKHYYNGIVDSGAATGTTATTADTSTTFIGDRSALNRNWDGLIEGLRVYDRVLTATEAAQLYRQPYAGLQTLQAPIWLNSISAAAFLPRQGLSIQQAVNRASTF